MCCPDCDVTLGERLPPPPAPPRPRRRPGRMDRHQPQRRHPGRPPWAASRPVRGGRYGHSGTSRRLLHGQNSCLLVNGVIGFGASSSPPCGTSHVGADTTSPRAQWSCAPVPRTGWSRTTAGSQPRRPTPAIEPSQTVHQDQIPQPALHPPPPRSRFPFRSAHSLSLHPYGPIRCRFGP